MDRIDGKVDLVTLSPIVPLTKRSGKNVSLLIHLMFVKAPVVEH